MSAQYITFTEIQKIKRKVKIQLKPCPFCGGKPVFRAAGYNNVYYGVKCTECKVLTPIKGGLDAQMRATEMWNKRAQE
jgi:Lar family restriction alleviation protein